MRKNLLFMCLCSLACFDTAVAQLKVDSLGLIQIRDATNTMYDFPNSIVTLGDNPNYYWGDFRETSMGIESCITSSSVKESIGIFSEVGSVGGETHPFSTTILGVSTGSSTMNYGVAGGVNGHNGAGIIGTTAYSPCSIITGSYAGFFEGPVYVNGNLTTTALYNLSDIRLKDNISLVSETEASKGCVIDNLQKLNIIEYNLRDAIEKREKTIKKDSGSVTKRDTVEENRRHYGLSAQELQGIYPDLVLEGQDGFLAVNYTELVPLLIRSIQELKAELDEVKGENNNAKKTRYAHADNVAVAAIDNATATTVAATLAQNNPNPFTERTEIRFSIPENTRSAYIYIFDMQGKMLRQIPVDASMQSVSINGYELSAGIYLYSLVVNGQEIDTRRMILSK